MRIAIFRTQRGATLVVTLVLVALLALLASYGVGISILDQRASANEYRAKEASLAAEAGIDQAIAYLNAHRTAISSWNWTDCTNTTRPPCGTILPASDRPRWKYITLPSSSSQTVQPYPDAFTLYILTPRRGAQKELLFQIVAVGKSADGASTNVTKQAAYFYPLLVGEVNAPLMAYGSINFNGNLSVVANPNGAGRGVPLSAWSNSDVRLFGSSATCQLSDFLRTDSTYVTQTDSKGNTLIMCASCTCPSSAAISSHDNEGIDILDVDGHYGANRDTANFPNDMFEYLFGVPTAGYAQIKQMAAVISDCSGLNTDSAGFYWVTGDCSISGNVGSFANPVLLVVEGNTSMNANNYVIGLIFAFSTNPADARSVTTQGGSVLYGGILTNANINLPTGTFKIRYDANVISNLRNNLSGRGLSKVPGSWADF